MRLNRCAGSAGRGCGRSGASPPCPTKGNLIFVIRSHPGSYVFMDHFLGRHMVRVDLIAGQSLRAVEFRVQDIVCIPLIGGADLQPLETGNHTHQGLQRLGDFLHRKNPACLPAHQPGGGAFPGIQDKVVVNAPLGRQQTVLLVLLQGLGPQIHIKPK